MLELDPTIRQLWKRVAFPVVSVISTTGYLRTEETILVTMAGKRHNLYNHTFPQSNHTKEPSHSAGPTTAPRSPSRHHFPKRRRLLPFSTPRQTRLLHHRG
jgi:hypothetical protein